MVVVSRWEEEMVRLSRLAWLTLLVLALLAVVFPTPVAAQSAINGPIAPLGGSNVSGNLSLWADSQGAAQLSVTLVGLAPRTGVQINLNAGSCTQPSASVMNLFSGQADDAGRIVVAGPVLQRDSRPMPLTEVSDGQHVITAVSNGVAVACGPVPALGAPVPVDTFAAAMLAEGERWQVMQFNPGAALQKRIFADGFVPNSGEFGLTLEATNFAVQRAEHLRTGAVRVYFSRVGDWANVRFYQRGSNPDALGRYLLQEAEQRQAIRFNPGAALQRRIFADGFVPNSGEFAVAISGQNYTGQRAEHLGTGRVRVYYAVTGNWGDVRYVERGAIAGSPGVSLAPGSGPSGTVVRVTGTGLPANVQAVLWGGPAGAETSQRAVSVVGADGRVTFDVQVQGAPGTRWVLGIVVRNVQPPPAQFTITG
jgi:hypothetical protein